MKRVQEKLRKRARRKIRVRKKISGSPERPRMSVYRSNRYTYVQVVDDTKGHTLCSASNATAEGKGIANRVEEMEKLGALIAEKLKKQKIARVVFDRNGYKYHGIVKAVAEGARKAGIEF